MSPSPSRVPVARPARPGAAPPARPHGLQLAGAQLDQRLALADELERLVEAGLARVQAADDLLDARGRGLIGLRLACRGGLWLACRGGLRLGCRGGLGLACRGGLRSVPAGDRSWFDDPARERCRRQSAASHLVLAPGGVRGGDRLAGAGLHERVSTLERALRVVCGEGEHQPLQLLGAARAAVADGRGWTCAPARSPAVL